MTRTFIDSGILIAAARGEGAIAERALAILLDPNLELASSIFLKLEVLPKANDGSFRFITLKPKKK